MRSDDILIKNANKIHTTELGAARIRKNLNLKCDDVTKWCKDKINTSSERNIYRQGKNYYIFVENCVITINASSYTIITAHKNSPQD